MEPTELEQIRCSTLMVDSAHGRKYDLDDKLFMDYMRTEHFDFYKLMVDKVWVEVLGGKVH